MQVLQGIPIELTAEGVVAAQARGRVRPALIPEAERAIALGRTLWQPRALYAWVQVHGVEGERVHISADGHAGAEVVLTMGPKADLLSGAQQALVGVGTLGPELEQRVHELMTGHEGLQSYLLDTAGVMALGQVGEALRCLAEEAALRQGWGVSAALSPGSLIGWSIRGQRDLCGLLPLAEIGVHLNDHCVLVPHKSFSTLIGIGPGYTATKVGSVCKYCSLQGSCWRRREDVS